MKSTLVKVVLLCVVVSQLAGCMSYLGWQDARRVRRYHRAVGERAEDEALIGTWMWRTPARSKLGHPGRTRLSLYTDGTYDSLHTTGEFYGFSSHGRGKWTNKGNMKVELIEEEHGEPGTAVDLSQVVSVLASRSDQLRRGTQPGEFMWPKLPLVHPPRPPTEVILPECRDR